MSRHHYVNVYVNVREQVRACPVSVLLQCLAVSEMR